MSNEKKRSEVRLALRHVHRSWFSGAAWYHGAWPIGYCTGALVYEQCGAAAQYAGDGA
ncbi:hypothetical protein XF_0477 [Xylella fastidiosa 9a5c]|uniref:Uncharacterized protein n=1 Tax=Xylella fastidiosa (strain 9a5c) TaxID=160492 RepID=Q9PG25_XYLFA|nr:hypothetical protein XF_0477 [Xylella fastidiosa 9a5c]